MPEDRTPTVLAKISFSEIKFNTANCLCQKAMTVRLGPAYLSNVIGYCDCFVVKNIAMVSKKCREAMLIRKTNPISIIDDPSKILALFPKTETMVLNDPWKLESKDTSFDKVRRFVLMDVTFKTHERHVPPLADRVTEIHNCKWVTVNQFGRSSLSTPLLRPFARLQKLTLGYVPSEIEFPRHRLNLLQVFCKTRDPDPFTVFRLVWADKIVFIFESFQHFSNAKARTLPSHVSIFCAKLGDGLAPDEFYPMGSDNTPYTITLSNTFWVEQRRPFYDRLLFQCGDVELLLTGNHPECDLEDFIGIKRLTISSMKDCILTLSTSIVGLTFKDDTRNVTLSVTENLTSLETPIEAISTIECVSPLELSECRQTHSQQTSQAGTESTPASPTPSMTIDPRLHFPPWLVSLSLKATSDVLTTDNLMMLSRLQRLSLVVQRPKHVLNISEEWAQAASDASTNNGVARCVSLNLSAFTSITYFHSDGAWIFSLPKSLVECSFTVDSDFDSPLPNFSNLTKLTSLKLELKRDVELNFPSSLKSLSLSGEGFLTRSNLKEVQLDSLSYFPYRHPVSRSDFHDFPTTLQTLQVKLDFKLQSFDLHFFPKLENINGTTLPRPTRPRRSIPPPLI